MLANLKYGTALSSPAVSPLAKAALIRPDEEAFDNFIDEYRRAKIRGSEVVSEALVSQMAAGLTGQQRGLFEGRVAAFYDLSAGMRERLLLEPDKASRVAALRRMTEECEKSYRRNKRELRKIQAHLASLDAEDAELGSIEDWLRNTGPTLEAPQRSLFDRLLDAFAGDRVIGAGEDGGAPRTIENPLPADTVPFLICHDWAKAFATAEGASGGDIKLPADECAFELQIGGRRLIYCVHARDGDAFGTEIFLGLGKNRWVSMDGGPLNFDLSPVAPHTPEKAIAALEMARAQIRAVCISLDAEVAVTETERQPHKRNIGTVHAPPGSYEFRIVKLANRRRYLPTGAEGSGQQKRLHFVRGHWRHMQNHKTWVKWHLRGNPDLGFIEKQYLA